MWMDNIKIDIGEREWGGIDWTGLAQDRDKWRAVVIAVMNIWIPYDAGKFLNSCTTGGLLSSAQLHRIR
jgi:hypothetical protein